MLIGAALLAAGCTKQNPAARCSTGTCIDPAYPFCDVDGALSGSAGSCISVSCTPGDFKACRGDVALTCNAMGNNYDELQCQKGCTPEAMGCRLCDAGTTVCANGEVQTCDANGAVSSTDPCPLGCFDSEPRCRQLDPSNGLGAYVDMAPNAPDVDLSASTTVNTGTGVITSNGSMITVPNFFIPAPTAAPGVRVFVVHNFHLASGMYLSVQDSTSPDGGFTGIALAIVATGTIAIDGEIDIAGPGSHADAACTGDDGQNTDNGTREQTAASGGGGFATPGAKGGSLSAPGLAGGNASGTIGNATLIPLRGGCPAGAIVTDNGRSGPFGTVAGGAIQLSAAASITVNGVINADGGSSYPFQIAATSSGIFGGGSGGGILLEAPVLTLGPQGKLLARGGAGGTSGLPPTGYVLDANPISAPPCPTSPYCGRGGAGAAPGVNAQAGQDAQYTTSSSVTSMETGGGGGGLGRIRVNTISGTYTQSGSSVAAGDITTGVVGTK